MSSETSHSTKILQEHDAKSVVGNDDLSTGEPETLNDQAEASRKAAKVIMAPESEEDDDEEEISLEEQDEDILAGYPDDTEDLELVHSRISACTPLSLPRFAAHLKRLCVRQNFIARLEPKDFNPLTGLEELDFYDNKLKNVNGILEPLSNLKTLDLSFNLLKTIPENLGSLQSLDTVYFVQNKISKIQFLDPLGPTLRSLELGGNKIRTIENLDALCNLQELWLGKNKITKLQNLGGLKRLRILSVQSNRLTQIEGLEQLTELEDLYLSHNGIEKLEGLENNLKLRTLDVGNNRIQILENVSHLSALQELWLNDNAIPHLHSVPAQLANLKNLQTVYLEGNPCQKTDMANYRRKLILALPQVVQIDATYVKR